MFNSSELASGGRKQLRRSSRTVTMTMILGYWDIRGLTHAIRLLLEYNGEQYEDKQYVCGPGPDYDTSDWTNVKDTLGLDFPNLPYLIDGHVRLTQSNAILRYIARKHKMCGESESEIIRVDMLENQVMDFRLQLASITYNQDFENLKGPYLEKLPEKLKQFSQFLGERKWFAGDKLTYADFLIYDVLDQHRMLDPNWLDSFPNLKNFLQQFEDLENIAVYMKTNRFMKTPVNMRMAKWCSEKLD